MGMVYPFSDVDRYLGEISELPLGCLVDTQLLIAILLQDVHTFGEDAEFIFEALVRHEIPIYSTVTTRSEFVDVIRRDLITQALMDILSPSSKVRISEASRKEIQKHRTWLYTQTVDETAPLLPDSRIKACKEAFLPRDESGKSGWLSICKSHLHGKCEGYWNDLVAVTNLNHLDLTNDENKSLIHDRVTWSKMCSIVERSCIGSSDAMIFNMLKCSVFPFVISADQDIAYAALADDSDKVVLVPDSIYRKKIKQLRF